MTVSFLQETKALSSPWYHSLPHTLTEDNRTSVGQRPLDGQGWWPELTTVSQLAAYCADNSTVEWWARPDKVQGPCLRPQD